MTITVPSSVVATLRRGLLIELSSAADRLGRLTAPGRLEESRPYYDVTLRLDATRNLLHQVGIQALAVERPIGLELNEYASTAYRILQAAQVQAIQAAEDAAHEGRSPTPSDSALDQFLRALKHRLDLDSRQNRMPFGGG